MPRERKLTLERTLHWNLCPEGTSENSPAFQRRVWTCRGTSPEGTAEWALGLQPSLRDGVCLRADPGVETPGYSQMSLRDRMQGPRVYKSWIAPNLRHEVGLGRISAHACLEHVLTNLASGELHPNLVVPIPNRD